MADMFAAYEHGLKELLRLLGKEHQHYNEALTLQSRLLENISAVRTYGDTETRRAERASPAAVRQHIHAKGWDGLRKGFGEPVGHKLQGRHPTGCT